MSSTFQRNVSFEEAKSRFVHRFTMDHIPSWSKKVFGDNHHYAPQFSSDREWYNAGKFPGDEGLSAKKESMEEITPPTWPLGDRLTEPFDPSKVREVSKIVFSAQGHEDFTLVLDRVLTSQEKDRVAQRDYSEAFVDNLGFPDEFSSTVQTAFTHGVDRQPDMTGEVFVTAVLSHRAPEVEQSRTSVAPAPSL